MFRVIPLKLIRLYQKTISPDHGFFNHRHRYGYCRFYPSCSEYTYRAIARYGTFKGGIKGIWRVLRCNPFNQGGFDPLK